MNFEVMNTWVLLIIFDDILCFSEIEYGWPAEIDFSKFQGGMISGLTLSQIIQINSKVENI